ncbi:MAG: zinc metallopeptidase [Verrucomicrobiota bacterium]
MYGFDPLYLAILGISMLASWLVSNTLQRKFAKYSRVGLNVTGREVAEQMLRDAGIQDVEVTAVRGQLTDHYNPLKKTVNLSEPVYGSNTLAAAAVAAHECGHAVQHATAYSALRMRSALVPIVNLSTQLSQWVIMGGLVIMAMSQGKHAWVFLIGIVLFAMTTLFSVITLPVEFDASKRALVWLERSGIAQGQLQAGARDALKWAAMTYVVAALASLGQLLYWILLFMRSRR